MASAFDTQTAALALKAKLPEKMIAWFLAMDCDTCEGVGLLAAEEKLIDPNILAVMEANGIEEAKNTGKKVAVRKFWTYCRTAYNDSVKPKPVDPHAPIDDSTPTEHDLSIAKLWFDRHHFVLPDAQFLIRSQVKALERDYKAGILRTWLAEELRTRSCSSPTKSGVGLEVTPGRPAMGVEVIADRVDKAFELYVRIRALLMSLSYVSIEDPAWFPLQIAFLVSEQIMGFITNTFNGRTPPLDFLIRAWAATIHYISEQMRIQSATPAAIFGAVSAWETKWAWSAPNALSNGGGPARSSDPDNKVLQNKLDSVNGQVKRLQAAADRASQAPTRRQRSRSAGRNDRYVHQGGGDGGKRGGKGGGKGGFAGRQQNAGNDGNKRRGNRGGKGGRA